MDFTLEPAFQEKLAMARVYHDVAQRAIQLHGALGASRETPIATEVRKVQVAGALLKTAVPAPGLFPTKREAARAKYAHILDAPAAGPAE